LDDGENEHKMTKRKNFKGFTSMTVNIKFKANQFM
jgi:hypothetical protein